MEGTSYDKLLVELEGKSLSQTMVKETLTFLQHNQWQSTRVFESRAATAQNIQLES